jgi:hypothetical protein
MSDLYAQCCQRASQLAASRFMVVAGIKVVSGRWRWPRRSLRLRFSQNNVAPYNSPYFIRSLLAKCISWSAQQDLRCQSGFLVRPANSVASPHLT